jgi:hypothetical protein
MEQFDAYVVFRVAHEPGWPWWAKWIRHRLRRTGVGHVSVIYRCPYGRQLVYCDPALGHLSIYGLPARVTPQLLLDDLGAAAESMVVLRYPCYVDRDRYHYYGILTCVTVVKSIIGVRAPWLWYPDQLFRWLLDNGATLHGIYERGQQAGKAEEV